MVAANGQFFVTADGRLIVNAAGQAIVGDGVHDCCCGAAAPCSCPGGLSTSYSVTFTLEVWNCDTDTLICTSTVAVTVTGNDEFSPCAWASDPGSVTSCGGFSLLSLALQLNTSSPCKWEVRAEGDEWTISTKATGDTPVGTYSDSAWSGCNAPFGVSRKHRVVNVSVAA